MADLKLHVEATEDGIFYYARQDKHVWPPEYLFHVYARRPNWIERILGVTFEDKCRRAKAEVEEKIRNHDTKTKAELDKQYENYLFLENHPELNTTQK